jgi:hypothetical protein
MDSNGNAVAVWVQNDGTYNTMFSNRYVAGAGWSSPVVIESNTGDADFARVAVNGSGNAMALWKQFNGVNYDIWANRYDAASGWGTATLIETNPGVAFLPGVGMDDNGNAVAVWIQNDGTDDRMWANRYVAGQGWGTATLIEPNLGFASFPHVAFDDGGNAIVVWYQEFGEATGRHIWANRYVVGSGWGTPTRLDSYIQNGQGPRLAVNGSGNAMAVWRQWDDQGVALSIWASRYDVGQAAGARLPSLRPAPALLTSLMWPWTTVGTQLRFWKQSDGTFNSIYANRMSWGRLGHGCPD